MSIRLEIALIRPKRGCSKRSNVPFGVKEWLALCPRVALYTEVSMQVSGMSRSISEFSWIL